MKLKGRHKGLVAFGLILMIAAWLSWTLLLAETDGPPAEPVSVDGGV